MPESNHRTGEPLKLSSEQITYPAPLQAMYDSGKALNAAGVGRNAWEAAVHPEDGAALYSLVRKFPKAQTLETGLAFGFSTMFLCQAHRDNGGGAHLALDPYQETHWESIGKLNVARAGFDDLFTWTGERSSIALPRLYSEGFRAHVIFIDGDHRFDGVFLDWFYADRMLHEGGYLVLHDPWMPATRKVVTFALRQHAEAYELAPEYMNPPASFAAGLLTFARAAIKNPGELEVARMFARKRCKNFIVLRKKRHVTEAEYDQRWNFYAPF